MTQVPPFPLLWPEGVPRTRRTVRSQFKTSLSGAVKNVQASLERFANDSGLPIRQIVATSNVAGLMGGKPDDPAVAVWFEWDGEMRCFPVDKYDRVECNVQAIHHIIEARRTELRHGGLNITKQTFKSFAALPAPGKKPWWEVLGVKPTASGDQISAAYKRLATERHPDRGGSDAMMSELNEARDKAKQAGAL